MSHRSSTQTVSLPSAVTLEGLRRRLSEEEQGRYAEESTGSNTPKLAMTPVQSTCSDPDAPKVMSFKIGATQLWYTTANLAIPEKFRTSWEQELDPLLDDQIERLGYNTACSVEFMLASTNGSMFAELKPCVIATFDDKKHRKKFARRMRQDDWKERFQRTECGVVIVHDDSLQLLGPSNETLSGSSGDIAQPSSRETTVYGTSSARPILVHQRSTGEQELAATVGGFVMVDGVIYGLTVGHPFVGPFLIEGESQQLGHIKSDKASGNTTIRAWTKKRTNQGSSGTSSEPEDTSSEEDDSSFMKLLSTEDCRMRERPQALHNEVWMDTPDSKLSFAAVSYGSQIRKLETFGGDHSNLTSSHQSRDTQSDWALVEISQNMTRQNHYTYAESGSDITSKVDVGETVDVVQILAEAVTVLTARKLQLKGYISSNFSRLKVKGLTFEVFKIHLDSPLRKSFQLAQSTSW